jgi:hypothetical protein
MIIAQPNSRLVGYARVSTNEQELNLQTDALFQHGVKKEHLFCDKISGAKEDRPGLTACNELLREGDTLVVWRLDRLGRSMRHLVNMIEDLKERGIGFRSISDGMIDTTSASGELVLNLLRSCPVWAQADPRKNKRGIGSGESTWPCWRTALDGSQPSKNQARQQIILWRLNSTGWHLRNLEHFQIDALSVCNDLRKSRREVINSYVKWIAQTVVIKRRNLVVGTLNRRFDGHGHFRPHQSNVCCGIAARDSGILKALRSLNPCTFGSDLNPDTVTLTRTGIVGQIRRRNPRANVWERPKLRPKNIRPLAVVD